MILVISHFYIGPELCKARIHGLYHEEITCQFCIIPCLLSHISINSDFRSRGFDIQFVFGINLLRKDIYTQ